MIIAVTGTPGTGKTAVSQELADRLDYAYVDVNQVAERAAVETDRDPERDATAVDVDSLVTALEDEVGDDTVLDGHLSHHFPADLTVVLRCSPDELEHRLAEKQWGAEKIDENVAAEQLDVLLQEAVTRRDRVAEIDTTGTPAAAVAETLADVVAAGQVPEELQPGHVSWQVDTDRSARY